MAVQILDNYHKKLTYLIDIPRFCGAASAKFKLAVTVFMKATTNLGRDHG